jgi:hypothetical protein
LTLTALEDIESALAGKLFRRRHQPFSVVSEFARQLAQLRETGSITETTFATLARKVSGDAQPGQAR